MKFATLGPRGRILTVHDTAPASAASPNYSIVEISDEQATTVQEGKNGQPKVFYFFENGELVTMQQRIQSGYDVAQGRLDAKPLSKIEMGESHVESQGFNGSRLVTCIDLLLQAKEAGTLADKPKLVAVYQWLQEVKAAALAGSITFVPAPFTFEEVLSEGV